jgi:hypothetical protein
MLLTILRTAGAVKLLEEDNVCGICRWYYRKSVVLPTKTLKALAGTVKNPALSPIAATNRHFKSPIKVIRNRLGVLYIHIKSEHFESLTSTPS